MRRPIARLSDDPYLDPFREVLEARRGRALAIEKRLTEGRCSLADFASGHEHYGLHRHDGGWVFREWAPNATAVIGTTGSRE